MPWFASWSDIKKKVCRYLLQRYLGKYIEEPLNVEQLSVELFDGKGTVNNVALNCKALNQLCEDQGFDIEVTDGQMESIAVTFPWNAIMKDDTIIEVNGLSITLKPSVRQNECTSIIESMWSSMSSSIQLAQDCMHEKSSDCDNSENNEKIEGLDKLAQAIENVLNRIKAKFINTEIKLEYQLPRNDKKGVSIIIKLDRLEYENEVGDLSPSNLSQENEEIQIENNQKLHLVSNYSTHHIFLEGLSFYTEEFRIKDNKSYKTNTESMSSYYSTISQFSETEQIFVSDYRNNEMPEAEQFDSKNLLEKLNSGIILFGKLNGQQELRIKMKQSQDIIGPKVFFDISFGSLYIFLTPRQIHLLITLLNAFKQQDISKKTIYEDRNSLRKQNMENWNRTSSQMSGLIGDGIWSDPASSDKSNENKFKQKFNQSSRISDYNSSLTNSYSSNSTMASSRYKTKQDNIDNDNDISNYSIRIASMDIIILHEDILVECSYLSGCTLNEKSVSKMIEISRKMFENIDKNTHTDMICDKNHLKINLSPVILEGEERRNNKIIIFQLTASIAFASFFEVLTTTRIPLLEFDRNDIQNSCTLRPNIVLTIKCMNAIGTNCSKKLSKSQTDIHITLNECSIEFDITLYDRLNAIFNTSPFLDKEISESEISFNKSKKLDNDLKLDTSTLKFRLRFPIIDSRPLHDPDRMPWWTRNIRSDFLLMIFQQFRLKYNMAGYLDIYSNDIDIYYIEKEDMPKLHIGKSILYDNTIQKDQQNIEYPRITLQFYTENKLNNLTATNLYESDSADTSNESLGATIYSKITKKDSPFSSKYVRRESDTPHPTDKKDDPESILFPADSDEMKSFCENSMKFSKIQIKVNLPIAYIQINSKHLYETLYNRINTDLLMWTPANLLSSSYVSNTNFNRNDILLNAGMMDSMYIPSTTFITNNSNDENTSSEDSENNVMWYSTNSKSRKNCLQITNKKKHNKTGFQLIIGQGILTMLTPVRDSNNRVMPGQNGEFVFDVDGLLLFTVNGCQNNDNLCYVYLKADTINVYHKGLIMSPETISPLRTNKCGINKILHDLLYPTPDGMLMRTIKGLPKRNMLSLAIQINILPNEKIKRIQLTAGIQKCTLRHRPTISQHSWLIQLIDIFDIVDYPIAGYTPYGVVTEMQLHLWDCSVDYRPINLQYRAIVDLGSFMISSNLTTALSGCTLRFISEECALCIAPYKTKSNEEDIIDPLFITSKELVSILNIGLFEISLRLHEKYSNNHPKFDLRASIQDVHITTCSDSARAMAQLISYFASDGDIITEEEEDHFKSIHQEEQIDLLSLKTSSESNPNLPSAQQERVSTMISDAMKESLAIDEELNDIKQGKGVEVFFFPDEEQIEKKKSIEDDNRSEQNLNFNENDSESSNELINLLNFENSVMKKSMLITDEPTEALSQVKQDLGQVSCKNFLQTPKNRHQRKPSDTDEDFCIIAEEERACVSKTSYEDVKISDDPIRIVDNHFSVPVGKPDLLKAPENFPMAVMRYTLCEMSLTWHLYGGCDFPEWDDENNSKNSKRKMGYSSMSDAYKFGVSHSKDQENVKFIKKLPLKKSWKTRGGPGRKHDILLEIKISKIKLSHEIYPTQSPQASRQVVLVTELEIRDRLQSSEINKFLYHPSTKTMSKKSSQHMVVIKALHIRPNILLPVQECSLRISLLPLRLNIDQDTLLFFVQFLSEIANGDGTDINNSPKRLNSLQQPIMMVDDIPETIQDLQARKMVSDNLTLLMDNEEKPEANTELVQEDSSHEPIFFREVIFSPEVLIRLDYHGRRIEMSRGPVAGLLMGLGQLQCSEIRLKKIHHRFGVLGIEKLFNFLIQEWLKDIKRNQLPAIISGVGPMYTIVQFFQGIRDLFWLPIEQYQKDGRIVRGLQLGAQSFTARTALAALEISARLIQLLQFTAETAYDMVSPGPSIRQNRMNRKGKKKHKNRPQDIREGVANAYQIVKEGISDTAYNVMEITAIEHDQKGYPGAVGAVVRQIPPIVFQPVVLATQATSNVLGGIKNQLVPEARIEALEKWKGYEE